MFPKQGTAFSSIVPHVGPKMCSMFSWSQLSPGQGVSPLPCSNSFGEHWSSQFFRSSFGMGSAFRFRGHSLTLARGNQNQLNSVCRCHPCTRYEESAAMLFSLCLQSYDFRGRRAGQDIHWCLFSSLELGRQKATGPLRFIGRNLIRHLSASNSSYRVIYVESSTNEAPFRPVVKLSKRNGTLISLTPRSRITRKGSLTCCLGSI